MRLNPFTHIPLVTLLLWHISSQACWGANHENIRLLLIPETETVISSEIAAQIQELNAKFGSFFQKGQKLISFDCGINQAELKKANAEIKELRSTHEVNQKLEKHLSISSLEVAVSAARLEKAQAELELKNTLVEKCVINAPFTGRVIEKMAHQHQYVTPGQPLLGLIDDKDLTLQLFVPSNWLSWLKKGNSFKVYIDEVKKKYQAVITVLGPTIDQVSQTLEIRAKIKGKHPELLAGMSGTATFRRSN